MYTISIADAVEMYVDILEYAFPCAVVFGIGNILVNMFLSAMYSGNIRLSGRGGL